MGGARRPGGQPLLRHGGPGGVRRHRTHRGAPARLRRPGQGRGVLVLAHRLDRAAGVAPRSLRHPSRRGPLLELCPEPAPKGTGKNRLHLDVRLETGDDPDDVAASIAERGGRELTPEWGELPWRVLRRPVRQRVLRASGAVVGHGHARTCRVPPAADPGVRLRTVRVPGAPERASSRPVAGRVGRTYLVRPSSEAAWCASLPSPGAGARAVGTADLLRSPTVTSRRTTCPPAPHALLPRARSRTAAVSAR